MGRLTGGVEFLHPGAEHSPVVGHDSCQHGCHAHQNHARCDLHLCGLLLEHLDARVCLRAWPCAAKGRQDCLQLPDVRCSEVPELPYTFDVLSDLLLTALSLSALRLLVSEKGAR